MARVFYERLSDESSAYLDEENSRSREHTAMILVFEGGPLATEEGGVRFERIREVVEMRLAELPRLRTKLRRVPLDGHPVWVDDQEFELNYHLRQSSLPRPGTHQQLCQTAARVAASRLDRSRPLWDCWVIEGVQGGRFALILKMHKALAHLEGADLLRAILSANEEPVTGSVSQLRARPSPSPFELFSSEVLRRWSPSRRLLGRGLGLLRTPGSASRQLQQRAAGVLRVMGYRLRPASESPFDGNLCPHRAYAFQQVDLDDVQVIRQALGGSVQDIVLTILTGAIQRFIQAMHVSPTTVDLRALVPVLEMSGDLAMPCAVELPVWEKTPEARHEVLTEQTRRILDEVDAAPTDMMITADEWNAGKLFMLGARALKQIPTGHVPILQSPGSRTPLYLDGAELVESYGILPLRDTAGLGISVLGYAGKLFFAFNCDPEIVKDVGRLQEAVAEEATDLLELAEARGPALRAVGSGRH